MKPLWRRYLTTRRAVPKRPGIIGRAIGNWKQFLLAEAYNDPMAIVLILAHQEMLGMLLGTGQASTKRVPKTLEEPLAHWSWFEEAKVHRIIPAQAEHMHDERWNVMVPQRDGDGLVVGLLVQTRDGHFIAMGTPKTRSSGREQQL